MNHSDQKMAMEDVQKYLNHVFKKVQMNAEYYYQTLEQMLQEKNFMGIQA